MSRACSPPPSMGTRNMPSSVSPLTLQLLAWVASRPRTYKDAMEAWRTSCPRMPIWEDAVSDGLVRLECRGGQPMGRSKVVLTPRGRAVLDESSG